MTLCDIPFNPGRSGTEETDYPFAITWQEREMPSQFESFLQGNLLLNLSSLGSWHAQNRKLNMCDWCILMYDVWVSCGSLLWPAVTVSTLWGALQAARAVVSTCTPLHARQSDRSTAMHARATQKKEHSDISTSKLLESMEGRWAKAGRVPSKLGFKVNFEIDWHD